MDKTPASGNGFDAALKALEDLESGAIEAGEGEPGATEESIGAIGFSDVDPADEDVAITADPLADGEEPRPQPARGPASAPPVAPVPATPTPASVPSAVAQPSSRMGRIAVGLALISSIMSAAGLLVAERTIKSAQLVVADARERQQQLQAAQKLIHDLELVRAKQIELLQMQQAQLANAPVSSAELQHRMEALQTSLAARDPLSRVAEVIREGQADNASRSSELAVRMERLESALARR